MTHIPQRMCIVCRKMYPKRELVKFVLEEDKVVIDSFQKKNGRGAYICREKECIDKAKKKRALSAKFKRSVEEHLYDEIRGDSNG